MLNLNRLLGLQFVRFPLRSYAKKPALKLDPKMRQVHEETLRHIDPYACVKVQTDIRVYIKPSDVVEYPNGDAFIAELLGGPVKNTTASMKVQVSDDEKSVLVELRNLHEQPSDFHCSLKVPIRANLDVQSSHSVSVVGLYSDEIAVKAGRKITTSNIRAEKIRLQSDGDIECKGVLLGKNTEINTTTGSVILDKVQGGDQLACKTSSGNIETDSCYSESSRFETDTGRLELRNVHRAVQVVVNENGPLNMSGVHGNLQVQSKGGPVTLQLSELDGCCVVTTEGEGQQAVVNISDEIEKSTSLALQTKGEIVLGEALQHLAGNLKKEDSNSVLTRDVDKSSSSLRVSSKGGIQLGKKSWEDSMKALFERAERSEK